MAGERNRQPNNKQESAMFAAPIRSGLYRVRYAGVTHIVPGCNAADAICTILQRAM